MRYGFTALAIFASGSAIAQNVGSIGQPAVPGEPELGSRIPTKRNGGSTIYSEVNASAAAYKLAECFVAGNSHSAKAYLAKPADSDAFSEKKIGSQLQVCMLNDSRITAKLQIGAALFRGMLAEALIATKPKVNLTASHAPKSSYMAPWMTSDASRRIVEEMGACLVDMKPIEVQNLVATSPGSTQAQAALSAVMPFVGSCLVSNATLKTNAIGLRSALAEALYHREFDPLPVAVPSTSGDVH